ncbi:hypothetical protein AKJ35_00415 [candidate division MSBL1 archaeon SCGC-AAA833F18]|uniref:Sulfatase N-terminal domain-containing protein n=4 Tax=candidate division MSBL1 TaxID=215777 RepID=A0A133VT36_9EURY|nr:hypothetical protein AKJ47_01655 [candidate division MSBL1 archaeon SCGC-AAA261G05]KXB09609.1 hypothetical protein AKJ35_00415 [candidate division MSBL1 archaeon SCGC-AAA833F18]
MDDSNIVFIIVDALRTDKVGCYGHGKTITSNIDDLAREGTLFENNYACINVTDPSLTTIFSGRYPISHGLINHGPHIREDDLRKLSESGTRFLPEILRTKGYATLAVDWLGRWHKQGYDYYSGLRPAFFRMMRMLSHRPSKIFTLIKLLYLYRKAIPELGVLYDEVITSQAIELMKKFQKQKFFLFVHYWGTHAPYISPENPQILESPQSEEIDLTRSLIKSVAPNREMYHLRWFDEDLTIGEILSRYEGAINFIDGQIGELMNELDELGLRENTLVVLTSDHGESLTEHGIYFDHHGLYDVSLHVPLIFRGSGFPEDLRVSGTIQHVDIVPTILNNLNYNVRGMNLDGKDTSPLIRGEAEEFRTEVYAEEAEAQRKRAVRTRDYKYIFAPSEAAAKCQYCNCIHGEVKELYDLRKDPQEVENILNDEKERGKELKNKFLNWSRKLKQEKLERERIREKIGKLKKLGKI